MRFLIDTNVLSELAKGDRCRPEVRAWYGRTDRDDLAVSVLVIGELRAGLEGLRPRDAGRALRLERWLLLMIGVFADRIVGLDRRIAEQWGWLTARVRPPAVDGLIAATALVHQMVVVTRNVRDFERTGVEVLNPFEPLP
ncbi:MAG TPA: type II toxin-antitoxin system VapC family toxin [Geminicoccaceae bacterium]